MEVFQKMVSIAAILTLVSGIWACGTSPNYENKRDRLEDQSANQTLTCETRSAVDGDGVTKSLEFCATQSEGLSFFDMGPFLDRKFSSFMNRSKRTSTSKTMNGVTKVASTQEQSTSEWTSSDLGRSEFPSLEYDRKIYEVDLGDLQSSSSSDYASASSSVSCQSINGVSSCEASSNGNCTETLSADGNSISVICKN